MKRLSGFVFVGLAALLLQCSKNSGTGGSTGEDVTTSHPSGFAIASPTAKATRVSVGSAAPRAAKKAVLAQLFAATKLADCAVSITILSAGNANCYGPSATYAGHPDGSPASGTFPGGDLGIWEGATADTEACSAAQLNSRMQGSASYADAGLFGTASMICAAKQTGAGVPAVGSSVDVTTAMSGLLTINGTALTVTSATLKREADTTDGFRAMVSEFVGTAGTTTYTLRMKHVPTAALNATFRGKISVAMSVNDGSKPQNCSASSATGYTTATSVEYERASATSEKYRMRDAQFCGHDADPYVSATNLTVDHSKKLSGGQQKGWANNANFLAAAHDPTTGAGNFAYAWQAGMGDGNVRALNLSVTEASGAYSGTAFFGFGDDIATTDGSAKKMICNWAGPGNSHAGITKVQKQVIAKAASATKFTVTSSNITYDPNNSCEDNSGGFSVGWNTVAGTPTTRAASTTTNDLVDVSTMSTSFTLPTAPTAVE